MASLNGFQEWSGTTSSTLMAEFDFQWQNLPSVATEYTKERVNELLNFTKLQPSFFKAKLCLDAGCGNGRYTYAMQQLGAKVESFDVSTKGVEQCKEVNPNAYVLDLMELKPNPIFDFVLCWGVLHHLEKPREGFTKVASQVKPHGTLHIMVYHKDTQKPYETIRRKWRTLTNEERMGLSRIMIRKYGGHLHGWWDALNPLYNWSYSPKEIKKWFQEEGFEQVELTQKYNINMRGQKKATKQ